MRKYVDLLCEGCAAAGVGDRHSPFWAILEAMSAGDRTEGPPAAPASVVEVSRSRIEGLVQAPGSKSYTNRALVIAGLANGTSRITNGLAGDDAESMVLGLGALGVTIEDESVSGASSSWSVVGNGGSFPARPSLVDARLAGTTLRFLSAVAALGHGDVTVTGQGPLLERPVGPLLAALRQCGAKVHGSGEFGLSAPVIVAGRSHRLGGRVAVDASKSSQFVTALLLVAPYFDDDLVLTHQGLGARGFIDMTIQLMGRHGVSVAESGNTFRVQAGDVYQAVDERVPPDASAASHVFTLAVASGGEVTVRELQLAETQPDFSILEVFEEFGAQVSREPAGDITVAAPKRLQPVDVDLTTMPDQLPNVAVLAALAPGISHIRGVAITRFHETDRIAAIVNELGKVGVKVEVGEDSVAVHGGGPLKATTFWAYHDHRMAMALTALATAVGDSRIDGADAVSKTYQSFWSDAKRLGLHWTPI
jgi:3-phosphoshikimate 1-carboxyvinyltransferase